MRIKNPIFRARLRVAVKRSFRAGALDAGRESITACYARMTPAPEELAMSSYLRKKYELALQGKEFCLAIFERWGRLFFNCPAHQPKEPTE